MDAPRQIRARRWLAVGAFGMLTGIGLSAVGQGPVGGWMSVAAAAAMVVGLHTFGRLGADAPEGLPEGIAPAKPRKKRKRRPKPED
jgi:hypothetical protein